MSCPTMLGKQHIKQSYHFCYHETQTLHQGRVSDHPSALLLFNCIKFIGKHCFDLSPYNLSEHRLSKEKVCLVYFYHHNDSRNTK